MPVGVLAFGAVASVGLGVAGMSSQAKSSALQAHAQAVDRESARQATILEYEKLDITIDQLTRQAGVVTGLVGSAIAGAGAEITSGISAQAKAVTFSALARDIEVSRLNADIAATRLGFGPAAGGPESEKAKAKARQTDREARFLANPNLAGIVPDA